MHSLTDMGMGYAFINMVTTAEVQRLTISFEGFGTWPVPSSKVCSVVSSRTQGLDETSLLGQTVSAVGVLGSIIFAMIEANVSESQFRVMSDFDTHERVSTAESFDEKDGSGETDTANSCHDWCHTDVAAAAGGDCRIDICRAYDDVEGRPTEAPARRSTVDPSYKGFAGPVAAAGGRSIKEHAPAGPTVSVCQTEAGVRKVQEWRRTTGAEVGVTHIVLSTFAGDLSWQAEPTTEWQDVLVDGARGPQPKVETFAARLTIAQRFAPNETFGHAQQNPLTLPALVLPELDCKRVVKTKRAISYGTEVSCVIIGMASEKVAFFSFVLPPGAFFSEQRSQLVPRFKSYRELEDDASHYARIRQIDAKSEGGRVIYRPSDSAPLGIVADKFAAPAGSNSLAPKWCITRAPESWAHEDDASARCQARGFTAGAAAQRIGRRKWFFRGELEDSAKQSAFQFSSGIVASMAAAQTAARKDGPKPKNSPTVHRQRRQEMLQPPRSQQPPPPRSQLQAPPPPAHFAARQNKGRGDRFHLALGAANHAVRKNAMPLKPSDSEPRGRLQGEMRQATASYTSRRFKQCMAKIMSDPVRKGARNAKINVGSRARWAEGSNWVQMHPWKRKAMQAKQTAKQRALPVAGREARDRASRARRRELQKLGAQKLEAIRARILAAPRSAAPQAHGLSAMDISSSRYTMQFHKELLLHDAGVVGHHGETADAAWRFRPNGLWRKGLAGQRLQECSTWVSRSSVARELGPYHDEHQELPLRDAGGVGHRGETFNTSTERLSHTALFSADRLAFVAESETQVIATVLDSTKPRVNDSSNIIERRRNWHARAEAGLTLTANRNWSKLDRKITDRVNDRQLEYFSQLCLDELCDPSDGWPRHGQMLEAIKRAITAENYKAPPAAGFDAAGARSEWAPVWSPDDYESDPYALDWVPSYQAFEKAVFSTRGAAGLDGWTASELRLIHTTMPFLIAEMYDAWLATTRMAPTDSQFECKKGVAAIHAIKAIRSVRLLPSKHLDRALASYFEEPGLEFLGHDPGWGIRLRVDLDDGPGIVHATAACRGRGDTLWATNNETQHAIIVATGVRCLQGTPGSRNDRDGIDYGDVEVLSNAKWRGFVAALSQDDLQFMNAFMSGATRTRTRTSSRSVRSLQKSGAGSEVDNREAELTAVLQKGGVDVSEFTWQAFADLYEEVHEKGMSSFETSKDGELLRTIRIVKVWLHAEILGLDHVLLLRAKHTGPGGRQNVEGSGARKRRRRKDAHAGAVAPL
ncbi:unnamed protein product [Prorocentrum cordatum]|uniref:Uncharacterized protein n=1 Tax=Prorocentrum cordatum TaxID=2364126 RepID=A0ABN9VK86_9DINO|nr:unnamed protein product [Polarella glacialis]